MSDPTIRLSICRQDGRCPECGDPGWVIHSPTKGVVAVWQLPCGCAPCINWACLAKHSRALLTEALRQRDAEKKVTYDRAAGVKGPHILVHRQMWDQLREERDSAIRKGAAERAMLDEILALPDIEAPTPGDGDNVAAVVANALEALREERDAAIAKAAEYKRLLGECLAVLVALPGNVKADQVPALCGKAWKVLNG